MKTVEQSMILHIKLGDKGTHFGTARNGGHLNFFSLGRDSPDPDEIAEEEMTEERLREDPDDDRPGGESRSLVLTASS